MSRKWDIGIMMVMGDAGGMRVNSVRDMPSHDFLVMRKNFDEEYRSRLRCGPPGIS